MRSSTGLVAGGCQWSPASRETAVPGGRGGKARIMRRFARDGYRRRSTPRSRGAKERRQAPFSDLGERLALILAAAVLVRGLADFIGLEEDHLRDTFVGVDLGRQWRGIGELQRNVAF